MSIQLLWAINDSAWRDRELHLSPKLVKEANLTILTGIQMENVFNLWQSQDKKDLSQEAYSQKDANRPELDSTERYILGKVIKSLLPHWGLGRWYEETSKLSIQINHAEVSFFTTFHSKSLSCLKCLGLECRRGEFSEDVVPSKPQSKSGPVILVSLHYWLKAWKPVRTNPGTRAQAHVHRHTWVHAALSRCRFWFQIPNPAHTVPCHRQHIPNISPMVTSLRHVHWEHFWWWLA